MPPEGIEKAFPKLVLSIPTFNELANAIEQRGGNVNNRQGNLILEKGLILVPPVDLRQTTIRRDVLIEAAKLIPAKMTKEITAQEVVQFCQTLYEWVYDGTMPKVEKGEEWI